MAGRGLPRGVLIARRRRKPAENDAQGKKGRLWMETGSSTPFVLPFSFATLVVSPCFWICRAPWPRICSFIEHYSSEIGETSVLWPTPRNRPSDGNTNDSRFNPVELPYSRLVGPIPPSWATYWTSASMVLPFAMLLTKHHRTGHQT